MHRDADLPPAESTRLELPTQCAPEFGRVDEERAAPGMGLGVHADDVVGDDGDLTHCVLPGSSLPRGDRDAERPQSSASGCRRAPQVLPGPGTSEPRGPGELPAPFPVAPAALRGRRPRREEHHPTLGREFRGQGDRLLQIAGRDDVVGAAAGAPQQSGGPVGIRREHDDPSGGTVSGEGGHQGSGLHPPVGAAHDHGERAPGERLDGRHRGEGIGGQGVVDEGPAVAHADRPAPAEAGPRTRR